MIDETPEERAIIRTLVLNDIESIEDFLSWHGPDNNLGLVQHLDKLQALEKKLS